MLKSRPMQQRLMLHAGSKGRIPLSKAHGRQGTRLQEDCDRAPVAWSHMLTEHSMQTCAVMIWRQISIHLASSDTISDPPSANFD
jgi:hypothetical protein